MSILNCALFYCTNRMDVQQTADIFIYLLLLITITIYYYYYYCTSIVWLGFVNVYNKRFN